MNWESRGTKSRGTTSFTSRVLFSNIYPYLENKSLICKSPIVIDPFNSGGDAKLKLNVSFFLAKISSNLPTGESEIVFPNCFMQTMSLILSK